ncbi:glycosyltransferase family 1 protein [Patulibacter sp.]|uniref:glycosyltransferase family 4 protein n=1 Tax=Patulibacter sp. TaxID=1912859 RepID=UPI00271ACD0F|nr:glycosyltransferase family 1 protein [Patulibacter sp.]MDO9409282.1 glycosyltransferase family 1 protein [Patulibacter sp.]
MRVLLDTSYALRGASGTATYVERLRAGLDELNVDVVAVGDEGRAAPGGGGWRSARNLLRDRWWLDVALPRLAASHRVDVVHHPLPAVFRPRRATARIAQVVTVHDLAFELLPDAFDPRFARWASRAHRAAALRADAVVTVSRTTARDVRERWEVPVDRIVVAPHGPGQWRARDVRHGATVRPSPAGPGRPYLLYVGDDEPRKDLPTLRAAHALLRTRMGDAAPDLVLAGHVRAPERDARERAATAAADGISAARERRVEAPDRDALLALMDGALALVHPALHEGVGLTPLEAMARGLPVVAAASPGLTETCEDAAEYVPPRDVAALAGVLESLAGDPRRLEALAVAGRRVAGGRSWTIAARRHVEAYTLAVEHARRNGPPAPSTAPQDGSAGPRGGAPPEHPAESAPSPASP